jgi:hypothetical protein
MYLDEAILGELRRRKGSIHGITDRLAVQIPRALERLRRSGKVTRGNGDTGEHVFELASRESMKRMQLAKLDPLSRLPH